MAYQGRQYGDQQLSGGLPIGKPPQPARPKRKIKWGRLLLVIFAFALVMGLAGLAGYGWYLEKKVSTPAANATPLPDGQPVNILLIGLDRDPQSSDATRRATMNTDTLLIARLDPGKQKVSLLSIPRDTRVQLPTGFEKVNAAYAIGGMDRLKQTVQELTSLPIDRYVMIDFPAFVGVIDSFGGLEFHVDKPIYNPEGTVALQPGRQQLNGQQALAVVRFRSEELGDIARADRQQRFVEALGAKIKQGGIMNWVQGLRAMSDSLQTDMTITEMGTLAKSVSGDGVRVLTHTVPGEFLNLYGVSYWKVNPPALQNVVAEMKK